MQTQVLKSLQDQNAQTIIEVKESIAKRFNVSESERKKMSSKRTRPIFDSKIV
ncbi:MAG: winged helix-turn-helix domain-containing protein [Nitrososphaerales archaeon]